MLSLKTASCLKTVLKQVFYCFGLGLEVWCLGLGVVESKALGQSVYCFIDAVDRHLEIEDCYLLI